MNCEFDYKIAVTILVKAAETIDRLGKITQDCKSCARLPVCNAYQSDDDDNVELKNCDYKWSQAEAVRRIKDNEPYD